MRIALSSEGQHNSRTMVNFDRAPTKNLYRLAATWMEMSHPIDLRWNDTDERDVFPFERIFLVEPSPAD